MRTSVRINIFDLNKLNQICKKEKTTKNKLISFLVKKCINNRILFGSIKNTHYQNKQVLFEIDKHNKHKLQKILDDNGYSMQQGISRLLIPYIRNYDVSK